MKHEYNFQYGNNGIQTFYETEIGNDYLCIYANKQSSNPNMYMAMFIKNGISNNVWDKQYNDRQRSKGYVTSNGTPTKCRLLGSEDIEYMKKKLIYCYENNKIEITA